MPPISVTSAAMFAARPLFLCSLLWLVSLFAITGTTLGVDAFSIAPSMIADGEQGVMLLHDGGVLMGKISHAPNAYLVVRAGSELQIAPSRVSFVGRTLRDAYDFRRSHLSSDTIEAHLGLADWCIRQNLLSEADGELAIARKLQADHPRLLLLDRRLVAAKERAIQPKLNSLAAPSVVVATPAAAKSQTSAAVLPDLPEGVVENFTRKVQPILVNNCTASKCHEPGGPQAFQLNRAILRGEANRRTTMQNLAAVLTLVDRENPEKSRLLTLPRQTHAGMSGPVMGPRQDQAFKHLADWVALIAPPKPAEEELADDNQEVIAAGDAIGRRHKPKAGATPPAELMALPAKPIAKPSNASGTPSSVDQDAKNASVDTSVRPANATDDGKMPSLRTPHRLRFGATAERWQPRDPYDPEIFNRRQHVVDTPATPAKP